MPAHLGKSGAASLPSLAGLLLVGLLLTEAAGLLLVATAAPVPYSVRAVHLLFATLLQEWEPERRRP